MIGPCADIWFLPIEDVPVPEAASNFLSSTEWSRADRFATDRLRARWIAGRVGLREILASYLAVTPDAVPITYRACTACGRPHGKPQVPGSNVSFNLSHTDRLAAVAVTTEGCVGLDIEAADSDRLDRTERLWLSNRELTILTPVPTTERPERLLRWWTAKEALVKWTGEGLNRDLREVEVVDSGGAVLETVSGANLAPVARPGVVGTVASSAPHRWRMRWWKGELDDAG